ncbi:hypothetical protein PS1_007617 [Malus domestica]
MVKLCFQSQENHFDDHPQFLIPQLHPINPAVHSTCLSQVILATGVTRTIDHLKNMAESLSLNFQMLISMLLSLAVGTEQIGCSSFSPNLVEIENFYWMIILPKLQTPNETEHPKLMDNALKIFIAIWNATLETMLLQFCLILPHFLGAESIVVYSFAINDLDQSQKSRNNILLEQFGARKASLGIAYFNFRDNGITALPKLNLDFSSRDFSDLIPSMTSVDVQLPVHRILHDWVLQIRGHVSKPIVFISLVTWSEVLSRNFVLIDLFLHHDKVRVGWANMRATLDFAIWFSLVYKGFTIIGWNLLSALSSGAHDPYSLWGRNTNITFTRWTGVKQDRVEEKHLSNSLICLCSPK